MKRALSAAAAMTALAALIAPLGAAAPKKDTTNPDLTIQVDPAIQTWPRKVTVSGRLQGPDNAGKTITLEANPFPYSGGFDDAGTTTTDANGDYTFSVQPQEHTNYRTVADVNPKETSGVVNVESRMKITRRVSDRTPLEDQTITFSGRVGPAHPGDHVIIQRRRPSGSWKRMTSIPLGPEQADNTSIYSEELEVHRDGRWRAKILADEDHLGNKSRSVFINVQ